LRQVAQLAAQQLVQIVQLAAKQLVQAEQLAERVHSPVQMAVLQQVQNSELAQILELVEFHPLVLQLQVLQLLPKTVLLVSMF
jgi:hypothetical protein